MNELNGLEASVGLDIVVWSKAESAIKASKAATAFGALNWLLFVVTLIVFGTYYSPKCFFSTWYFDYRYDSNGAPADRAFDQGTSFITTVSPMEQLALADLLHALQVVMLSPRRRRSLRLSCAKFRNRSRCTNSNLSNKSTSKFLNNRSTSKYLNSRSISSNPLFTPQPKIFDDSLAPKFCIAKLNRTIRYEGFLSS